MKTQNKITLATLVYLSSLGMQGCKINKIFDFNKTSKYSTVEKLGNWDKKSITEMIKNSKSKKTTGERVLKICNYLKDVPYGRNTLGGGPDKKESLTVDLSSIDCVTFVEYSLAMATARDYDSFLDHLKK